MIAHNAEGFILIIDLLANILDENPLILLVAVQSKFLLDLWAIFLCV